MVPCWKHCSVWREDRRIGPAFSRKGVLSTNIIPGDIAIINVLPNVKMGDLQDIICDLREPEQCPHIVVVSTNFSARCLAERLRCTACSPENFTNTIQKIQA